jgi:predicted nucleotidyltransferase
MPVWTLSQRRAAAVAAKVAAVAALRPTLAAGAVQIGGRFLIYGSAARGELRPDSDVDLLLDFPDDASTSAAWDVAETACEQLGLTCDIRPLTMCDARFLDHVLPEAAILA